VELDFIQVEKG